MELVRTQHEKALKILRDNKRKLDEIAEYLYFKETITGDEFMTILNRKPEPRLIGTSEDAEESGQNPDESGTAADQADHTAANQTTADSTTADHTATEHNATEQAVTEQTVTDDKTEGAESADTDA